MRKPVRAFFSACLAALSFPSQSLFARSIYLNGRDISSAYNQNLKQVDISIDAKGNIYISAPNYQVDEEDTFLPLSKQLPRDSTPIPLSAVPKEPMPITVKKEEAEIVMPEPQAPAAKELESVLSESPPPPLSEAMTSPASEAPTSAPRPEAQSPEPTASETK